MATTPTRRTFQTPGLDHVGLHVPSAEESLAFFERIGYRTIWTHGPFGYSGGRWAQTNATSSAGQRHHVGHAEGARLKLALLRLGNGPNLELIEIAYPSGDGGWSVQHEPDHGRHSFVAWSVGDLDRAVAYLQERGLGREGRRRGAAYAFESPWGQRLAIVEEPESEDGTAGLWLPADPGTWRGAEDWTPPGDRGAAPAGIPTVAGTLALGFNVADLDAAARFFCDSLGFDPICRTRGSELAEALFGSEAEVDQLTIRCGNSNFILTEGRIDGDPLYDAEAARIVAHPAWYVPSFDQAVDELNENGLQADSLLADMFGAEAGEKAQYLHFLYADQDLELVSYPHGRSGESTTATPPWHPGKPGSWANP